MSLFKTLDLWAPLELTTWCYEASFLLFANARGGHYYLANARPPGFTVYQMARVCPGEMLVAGIDSHICTPQDYWFFSKKSWKVFAEKWNTWKLYCSLRLPRIIKKVYKNRAWNRKKSWSAIRICFGNPRIFWLAILSFVFAIQMFFGVSVTLLFRALKYVKGGL